MATVLDCEKEGRAYLDDCRRLRGVSCRTASRISRPNKRRRVLFSGPKSIYTVATGEMLQSQILSLAGPRIWRSA